MVKSETTFRRELKAVQAALKDDDLLIGEREELIAVKATLQWALGKHNIECHGIPPKPPESRRPALWVTDRSGGTVD